LCANQAVLCENTWKDVIVQSLNAQGDQNITHDQVVITGMREGSLIVDFLLAPEVPPMSTSSIVDAIDQTIPTYTPSDGVEVVPAVVDAIRTEELLQVTATTTTGTTTATSSGTTSTITAAGTTAIPSSGTTSRDGAETTTSPGRGTTAARNDGESRRSSTTWVEEVYINGVGRCGVPLVAAWTWSILQVALALLPAAS